MRLWHQALISRLPRQQLLGQHRECCALRGNGWGRRHRVVNYVFRHSLADLFAYHRLVMAEMGRRGYRVDQRWLDPRYRGRNRSPDDGAGNRCADDCGGDRLIYPEHDPAYLEECLENLRRKGIDLS